MRRRLSGETGLVTIQFIAIVALSLLLVVMLANLLVFSYGRGVVRAALDEGVRAGARATAGQAECLTRANDVLEGLLGGPMRAGVGPISCWDEGDRLRASANATFTAWMPGVPSWAFTVDAVGVKEQLP